MLHIALKEFKLDSIITGLPVKLNLNEGIAIGFLNMVLMMNIKKNQRNNVTNLIRKAKKTYFETIIKNKGSPKSIWTGINGITGKKKYVQTNSSISLTANDFSSSFAYITNSSSNIMSDDDLFKASTLTHAFCQEKLLEGHVKFDVPLMTMDDLITYFRILKPKKIMFI